MSWDKDWHFLKYAGAPPARQMFNQQRAAAQAAQEANASEKPLDSPDRPSNILRSLAEGTAQDIDNPSSITASLSAFIPPVREGEELTVVKDSLDNPSTILKANGEFKPPADAPPGPLPQDLPGATALPPETATPPQPEETSGQIVRQTA